MLITGKNSSLFFVQLEYHPMLAKVTTRLCNKILTGFYAGLFTHFKKKPFSSALQHYTSKNTLFD